MKNKRNINELAVILSERFYRPSLIADIDAAVDYALSETGGDVKYRQVWRRLCLVIGINSFNELLFSALSRHRQGEINSSAAIFYLEAKLLANQTMKEMRDELS